jgi:nucleoid DNA-binding protein
MLKEKSQMRFINQFPADIQQAFYDAEELKLMPFGKYTGRTSDRSAISGMVPATGLVSCKVRLVL